MEEVRNEARTLRWMGADQTRKKKDFGGEKRGEGDWGCGGRIRMKEIRKSKQR